MNTNPTQDVDEVVIPQDAQHPEQIQNNDGKKISLAVLLLVAFGVVGVSAYYLGRQQKREDTVVVMPYASPVTEQQQETANDASPEIDITPTVATTVTYDNKYFTAQHPSSWHIWSYGRGVSLDYYQINSKTESDSTENNTSIAFDIQDLTYTDSKTIAEKRTYLESNGGSNPYIISDITVDGQPALQYERTVSSQSLTYEKTVWLVKGDVKYIINLVIRGSTASEIEEQKKQYAPEFDKIIATLKLK